MKHTQGENLWFYVEWKFNNLLLVCFLKCIVKLTFIVVELMYMYILYKKKKK